MWNNGAWTEGFVCIASQLSASEARARELHGALASADPETQVEIWRKHAAHFRKGNANG
jgi:hypothetical protein